MTRTIAMTLACLLLGFPVAVGIVAALGRAGGLPPAQGLYLSLLLGPVLWTALYALILWHGTPVPGRKSGEDCR